MIKLWYTEKERFTLKLQDWDLYHAKKVLFIKLQLLALFILTPSLTLNDPVMFWLTTQAHIITLLPPCYFHFATGMSELDEIHLLTHLLVPLNVTQDSSVKISLEKSIQIRQTRHAGHCWRSRDELISDVLQAKAGRPAWTYIQQFCEGTGCSPEDQPEAMNDRENGERGSGISMLAAWHDDDVILI